MAKFSYKAKNAKGKVIKGSLEASDARAVSTTLRGKGLVVIDVKNASASPSWQKYIPFFTDHVSLSEITNLTRQLAVMISAGLTISEALAAIRNQATNKAVESLVANLLIAVEGGISFSKALSQHKDIFPKVYISVVHAGEASGLLDKMLTRLADALEKQREFEGKVKGAFLYPFIILIGVGIVVAILMLFVVPQMSSLYDQLAIELPLSTRIVVTVSNLFVGFWFLIPLLLAGALIPFYLWRKTVLGNELYSRFLLDLPAWGRLERNVNLTQLASTLGLLVNSGTPIIDALADVSGAVKNVLFSEAILRASRKVEKGVSLATAFSQEPILPALIAQMAGVGEETGKLDEVMLKLSMYFEGEVDRGIKTFTTVLEPVVLLVMGIVVGFLMLAVFLPIYNLAQAI